jgi:hypothetical protein
MENQERTELEKQVDKETIEKGADVSQDFDQSQALLIPAKLKGEMLKEIAFGLEAHMGRVVEKEASDPKAREKILLDQLKHKRKQMKKNPAKGPQIVNKDNFMLLDDAQTMMFYELIQLNDSKINAILTKAQFQMADLNGKSIFPKAKS